jgi:hypothetical protein
MESSRYAWLPLALAAALTTPAFAQVAGNYQGYSADGELVAFKVAPQRGATKLEIREAYVTLQARCEYSRISPNGVVIFAVDQAIDNGKVSAERANAAAFDIAFDLTFSGDGQSASGSIRSIIPGLDTSRLSAERALYCVSPTQPMQVTLMSANAKPPAQLAPIIYDWRAPRGGRP